LDYILTKIRNLDRPDKDQISISADIIVWFAWETDEDFQQTVEWVKKYKITKLHAFPFSSHDKWESIPAHLFKNQVPFHIKKQRERELISVWNEIREKFIAENKWLPQKVLIEEKKNGKWRWWTGNYIQVELDWDYKRWEIVNILL
jgi:threonylcarbamoyladenosine tRNA methylthiotransferase MtaB